MTFHQLIAGKTGTTVVAIPTVVGSTTIAILTLIVIVTVPLSISTLESNLNYMNLLIHQLAYLDSSLLLF